ncbi:hypothetical protein BHM03_00006416 [Ensete ventricosum]|nr:hypothetical protein BHM03_00006416 [Ensete ventricosum]
MVAADEPRNSFDLVRFEGHHDPEIGGIGRAATLDAKVARKDELRRQKEAPIAFHRLEHGERQKGRRRSFSDSDAIRLHPCRTRLPAPSIDAKLFIGLSSLAVLLASRVLDSRR